MPQASYLVFGNVLNAIGDSVSNASLKVKTSLGEKTFTSDSNGIYMFDLAEVGYVAGGAVTIDVTDPFNNEFIQDSFIVEGMFREADITTEIRTLANDTTGGFTTTILHSVGGKPITSDNPLPTKDTADPLIEYMLAGEDSDNVIFGYLKTNGAWYIQRLDETLLEYLYVKGNSDFATNWAGRAGLTYQRFNVVF